MRSATVLLVAALASVSVPASAEPAPVPVAPPYAGSDGTMDAAGARRLAGLSLACVDRPFPNKPGHVIEFAGHLRPPKVLTPAFHGCFDWHSAVHGHWALARVLKAFPGLPDAAPIRAALSRHLRPDVLARERAFFQEKRNRTFERPYGWGWYLRLAAELRAFDDPDARRWSAAVEPLARDFAASMATYLARLSFPIREGTHANTAFALTHAWDYAVAADDATLKGAIDAAARRFYLADRACPLAYEPSGEDFLSPCLAEADLVRRVLPAGEFREWLRAFLPSTGDAAAFQLEPPEVRDRQDPRIGHLIGLDFHRAWCLLGIASALPPGDPLADRLRSLADAHRSAGLSDMQDSGYGGEHWLASFALYLLAGSGR